MTVSFSTERTMAFILLLLIGAVKAKYRIILEIAK
jgi:hypothetical protein